MQLLEPTPVIEGGMQIPELCGPEFILLLMLGCAFFESKGTVLVVDPFDCVAFLPAQVLAQFVTQVQDHFTRMFGIFNQGTNETVASHITWLLWQELLFQQ